MNCSMLGLAVHHQLPESTKTHVHWVGDAIQPSHSRSSPTYPAFNRSQHQGLFKWVISSHQGAKLLEFQPTVSANNATYSVGISPSYEYSGLISFRMDWLDLLAAQGTQEYSPTPQFKSINSSVLSFLHRPTLPFIHDHWKNHNLY